MPQIKDQFRNDSGGVAGAVILVNGDFTAIPIQPEDTVWLSEEEQAMTANAPKLEENNPFINGTFTLITEGKEIAHARPLRPTRPSLEETGAAPIATGAAPEGGRPPTEEVGTPDAVPADAPAPVKPPEPVAPPEPPEVEVAGDGKHIVKAKPKPKS